MRKTTATKEQKELMEKVVNELNEAGFKGGLYYYKEGECSCCYGGNKSWFFQINGNTPSNRIGDKFYYKIYYDIDDKDRAEEFRRLANALCGALFGKSVSKATSIYKAVIVRF